MPPDLIVVSDAESLYHDLNFHIKLLRQIIAGFWILLLMVGEIRQPILGRFAEA
jgi:hypothetical protein